MHEGHLPQYADPKIVGYQSREGVLIIVKLRHSWEEIFNKLLQALAERLLELEPSAVELASNAVNNAYIRLTFDSRPTPEAETLQY